MYFSGWGLAKKISYFIEKYTNDILLAQEGSWVNVQSLCKLLETKQKGSKRIRDAEFPGENKPTSRPLFLWAVVVSDFSSLSLCFPSYGGLLIHSCPTTRLFAGVWGRLGFWSASLLLVFFPEDRNSSWDRGSKIDSSFCWTQWRVSTGPGSGQW